MNQSHLKQQDQLDMRKEFNDYFAKLSEKLYKSSINNLNIDDNSGSWNEMADFDNRWSNR